VIEDAIAAGAEAIGVSCNDPTACIDPINKALAAGIPVMTWDADSPRSGRFTYLAVDNYIGGRTAAEMMKKALPDGGRVALLTGVPGAFSEERLADSRPVLLTPISMLPPLPVMTTSIRASR
jgi:ribose transport system substrate-binding protein